MLSADYCVYNVVLHLFDQVNLASLSNIFCDVNSLKNYANKTAYSCLGSVKFTLLICVCFYSCRIYVLTYRISDNMHHWSDVLFGAGLGALVAYLMVSRVGTLCRKLVLGIEKDW